MSSGKWRPSCHGLNVLRIKKKINEKSTEMSLAWKKSNRDLSYYGTESINPSSVISVVSMGQKLCHYCAYRWPSGELPGWYNVDQNIFLPWNIWCIFTQHFLWPFMIWNMFFCLFFCWSAFFFQKGLTRLCKKSWQLSSCKDKKKIIACLYSVWFHDAW